MSDAKGKVSSVINIEDYRPQVQFEPGRYVISFIGFEFMTPEGNKMRLSRSWTVDSELIESSIEAVKQEGGIYLPIDDKKIMWFLPWPCAAVRVCPVPE